MRFDVTAVKHTVRDAAYLVDVCSFVGKTIHWIIF